MAADERDGTFIRPDAESQARCTAGHWLSRHKTGVALTSLAALLFVCIVWPRPQHPFDIDTTPCDGLGLSSRETKTYRPVHATPLLDSPYVYCEFNLGSDTWSGDTNDQDKIGLLIDTRTGKRVLRIAWHNYSREFPFNRWRRWRGIPRFTSKHRPVVYVRGDYGEPTYNIDLAGAVEPIAAQQTVKSVTGGACSTYGQIAGAWRPTHRFRDIQAENEELSGYLEGLVRAAREDFRETP